MLNDFLKKNITSYAGHIQANGQSYGQFETNHLSRHATKDVYAQLPADKNIDVLDNCQFAKYDYANSVVNFTGPGEWMLVFNEVRVQCEYQVDAQFVMIKDNYQARVYSPFGGDRNGNPDTAWNKQSRYYNGQGVNAADGSITFANGQVTVGDKTYPIDDVTAGPDYYEPHYNEDPFHIESLYQEKMMPEAGSSMVPRVLKTHVGDIFTTNMIADASVAVGNKLVPNNKGILAVKAAPAAGEMVWQVVKVYTMPDHQPGVKLMRIK